MTTMPAGPMTCEGFADALMGYLEHDAPHGVRVAVENHAATCASCAALLADIQEIEHDASTLPELAPPRDLWSGIAARIEAPVVEIAGGRGMRDAAAPARRAANPWMRRGLAAAGIVAIAAGGSYMLVRRDSPAPAVATTPAPASPTQAVATLDTNTTAPAVSENRVAPAEPVSIPVARAASREPSSSRAALVRADGGFRPGAYRSIDSLYGAEIGRLRRLAASKKSQLDPRTVAIIEKNLKIIDQAIRESREAIARDPNSTLLNDQINRMLDQKVELLRAMATMPVRS